MLAVAARNQRVETYRDSGYQPVPTSAPVSTPAPALAPTPEPATQAVMAGAPEKPADVALDFPLGEASDDGYDDEHVALMAGDDIDSDPNGATDAFTFCCCIPIKRSDPKSRVMLSTALFILGILVFWTGRGAIDATTTELLKDTHVAINLTVMWVVFMVFLFALISEILSLPLWALSNNVGSLGGLETSVQETKKDVYGLSQRKESLRRRHRHHRQTPPPPTSASLSSIEDLRQLNQNLERFLRAHDSKQHPRQD